MATLKTRDDSAEAHIAPSERRAPELRAIVMRRSAFNASAAAHAPAGDTLDRLARAVTRETLAAFRLDRPGPLQPLATWLAGFPARRLARRILHFDDIVRQRGLAAAGRYILAEFTRGVRVEGRQHIPPGGPLLAVSNHPGVVDAMAIWVALELRPDLKVIASRREILQLLPGLSSRLLFVEPGTEAQSALLRHAARHLRAGGALLTFPAGAIEPDPQIRVADTLETWSPSTELLVRMVPETLILPIAVSGVISRAAHHAMARRFTTPRDREWAAATLQVLCRRFRPRPRVVIGPRITGQQAAIRTSMTSLLQRARAA